MRGKLQKKQNQATKQAATLTNSSETRYKSRNLSHWCLLKSKTKHKTFSSYSYSTKWKSIPLLRWAFFHNSTNVENEDKKCILKNKQGFSVAYWVF